jgi:hypothetical protein
VQFGLAFHRERSELGVCGEVSGCAELFEITEEKAGEFRPGVQNNDGGLIQPRADEINSAIGGKWFSQNPPIGHGTNKS